MKISLIGGGNIGGMLARSIAVDGLAEEVVILDIDKGMACGKALDISQSLSISGGSSSVIGCSDYNNIKGSAVVVVTAGISRKPGMNREDLLNTNTSIIKGVGEEIAKYAKDSFVIVITNPLDAMTFVMQKSTGFSRERVVGMAGVLDSARLCYFLACELGCAPSDVNSLVMGSHGDSMVPLLRYSSVAGIPLSEFINTGMITRDKVDDVFNRTKSGGAEIVELLGNGSAYYAPAESALYMVKSYVRNQMRVLTCSINLSGYYGVQDDIFCGAPVIIGNKGVEKILELDLDSNEKRMFDRSVKLASDLIKKVKI